MNKFICNNYEHSSLDMSNINSLSIGNVMDLHQDANNIAKLAIKEKVSKNDIWVKLPFCSTLEGELLGANTSLTLQGAKIKDYSFKSIEEIPKILNLNSSRMNCLSDAMKLLNNENIIYNIEGPFTILSCLVDSTVIFKAIRKEKEEFNSLLSFLEDFIVEYGTLVYNNGAKILSFGDPVATIDIIGPNIFNNIYKNSCIKILKRLSENCPNAIIHLCGKLSQNLIYTDSVKVDTFEFPETLTYGESLIKYKDLNPKNQIIGYMCINRTNTNYNHVHPINLK
ncbi:uroporphyrinogen decarboxylase family protein [Clostridium sp.]|uniref:uroporphyrinogen decarboxylase family protein n=1 Tax=Clostridium sp. TaxID=1506 RepID=UPI00321775C9